MDDAMDNGLGEMSNELGPSEEYPLAQAKKATTKEATVINSSLIQAKLDALLKAAGVDPASVVVEQ